MQNISIDQWILIVLAIVSLLFGTGLYYRLRAKKDKNIPGLENTSVVTAEIQKATCEFFKLKIQITTGDYKDIDFGYNVYSIKVNRIFKETFKIGLYEKELLGAEITIHSGGGVLSGGESTKCVGVNVYKLPEKQFEPDEPFSIFSFGAHRGMFGFFRTFVEHINPNSGVVTLNVFWCAKK